MDADAAQRIDRLHPEVCRTCRGRAIVVLMLMHDIDGDPGSTTRRATNVMVTPAGFDRNRAGAQCSRQARSIHHLPVDQAFTLEAGTRIWGYPKVMADFTIRDGHQFGDLTIDNQFVLGMEFKPGLPIPMPVREQAANVLHRTRWRLAGDPVQDDDDRVSATGQVARESGGGEHPYARELAERGFPETRIGVEFGMSNVADVVRRRPGDLMTTTKPDVDLTDGAFYAGDSRSVYKWMRENEPVFRDRNGLAGAATYAAVIEAERQPELFSNAGGIRPDQDAPPTTVTRRWTIP